MMDQHKQHAPAPPKLDAREEHFRIPSPHPGLQLFLRYLPPTLPSVGASKVVLYIHGGTFPSALSIAHRFDGHSWRDALCAAGFHVWGFDFLGFGASDRYPAMREPPEANAPLCRSEDAAPQIDAAVRFILAHHGAPRLSIIAHSWGTIPAARFAGEHPPLVDRLVLFGPIACREPAPTDTEGSATAPPAWRVVTLRDQWSRFVEDVPQGEKPVLSRAHFAEWGERYLDSDADSRRRDPPAVKVPTGPFADIQRAWHGDLACEPGRVRAPVAIIRGEWDGLVPDRDARWLFDAFANAALKRDIKIGRATHLMHLEAMRLALYRESIAFLEAGDTAPLQGLPNPAGTGTP